MSPVRLTSTNSGSRPFVIMAIIAIGLTAWQHGAWKRGAVSLPEYLVFVSTAPIETALTWSALKIHDAFTTLVSAPRLAEENRALKDRISELEAERIIDVDTRLQLKALREKIGLDPVAPYDKLAAWVIARSSGRQSCWVKIRASAGKQLEVGNVVREAKGLVGRVVEAEGSVGRVALLIDPQHAVRARDLRTGDEGMIHVANELTAGPNRLKMEKTRSGAQIAVGDIIVTSSLGETYPGGVPIGVVEAVRKSPANVSSLVAYIKPYVDFEHLNYVNVLRAGEK